MCPYAGTYRPSFHIALLPWRRKKEARASNLGSPVGPCQGEGGSQEMHQERIGPNTVWQAKKAKAKALPTPKDAFSPSIRLPQEATSLILGPKQTFGTQQGCRKNPYKIFHY
jgi:hypothetical protein